MGYFVVVGAWLMPDATQVLNGMGVPVGPLLMFPVLLLAGETPGRGVGEAAIGAPSVKR